MTEVDRRIVTRHKPPAATLPLGLSTDVPIDPDPLNPHPEHPTPIELVVRLTASERITRVKRLTEMAWNRYDEAIDSLSGKNIAGICSLVSGGNDSYTVAHLFRSVTSGRSLSGQSCCFWRQWCGRQRRGHDRPPDPR